MKIIILIIFNHNNMHLWLYFKRKVHKIHDINAWNYMLLVSQVKESYTLP